MECVSAGVFITILLALFYLNAGFVSALILALAAAVGAALWLSNATKEESAEAKRRYDKQWYCRKCESFSSGLRA